MTGRDVGILACRLMALYALLQALSMIAGSMPAVQLLLTSASAGSPGGWMLALAIAPLLFGRAMAGRRDGGSEPEGGGPAGD
jgi:hypothetical protein